MALNEVELVWLNNNPTIINELNNFLSSNNSQESIEIAWQHLNTLMNDAAYYDFVINYQSNNSGQGVWWENDNFISNPVNISFDADPIDGILKV